MKVIDGGIKRKYYKYGTTLNSAITQVGGTYENGLYTSSGQGQALQLPVLPLNSASSWEIQFSINYTSGGNYPALIAPSTASYGLIFIIINGYFEFDIFSSSSATKVGVVTSSIAAQIGNSYDIRIGFTGSQYYFDIKINGEWINQGTINSTTHVYSDIPLWLGNWGYTNQTRWFGVIDVTKTKIYINGELYLTGTQPEPATESDYDYYEDVEAKELVANYSWQDWTQLVLTNNGTVGGDNYACVASSFESSGYGAYLPYYAFDGNSETSWGPSSDSKPQWLTFYSPTPLKISNVSLEVPSDGECISSGEIQGSNDNSNWATLASFSGNTSPTLNLAVTDNTPYQYIRLYVTAVVGSSSWGKVKGFNIAARYSTQKFYAVRNY